MTDETGRIIKLCDPGCTGSYPVYLVAWNVHGDAISVSAVDPASGGVTVANQYSYDTWGRPPTTTANGYADAAVCSVFVILSLVLPLFALFRWNQIGTEAQLAGAVD